MSLTIKGEPNEKRSKHPDFGEDPNRKPLKLVRRASLDERQRAQFLLDQFEVDCDLQMILDALKRFAREGTFAHTDDQRPMFARSMARCMKGARFDDKVQAVVENFRVSEATAARWLRKRTAIKP